MIKRLYEKFVIWGYVRFGMAYGDAVSYMCYNDSDEQIFTFFEKKYVALGYSPIAFTEFVTAGGYVGESHLTPFLYKKDNNG